MIRKVIVDICIQHDARILQFEGAAVHRLECLTTLPTTISGEASSIFSQKLSIHATKTKSCVTVKSESR
jgi:hypothetical protein